jgi:hypothetical protein
MKIDIREVFKEIDLFGQKLELNLNGKKSRTTLIGGLVTLIYVSIMIAYAASSLHSRYSARYTWNFESYTKRLQMKDDEPFYIHEDTGFLEGMRIED